MKSVSIISLNNNVVPSSGKVQGKKIEKKVKKTQKPTLTCSLLNLSFIERYWIEIRQVVGFKSITAKT